MKKKLLFVMTDLHAGGGQKSLMNLLYQLDYGCYEVDLFLFSKTGVFLHSLPKEVRILELPDSYKLFADGLKSAVRGLLQKGKIKLAYARVMLSLKVRTIKNISVSEQSTWKYRSRPFDKLEQEYDAAIGYLEKSCIYFVADKVIAKKKIGWVHTNYSESGMNSRYDHPYFNQLDHIVTVSEKCAESLKENFGRLEHKIKVIYNIVSPKIIRRLSDAEIEDGNLFDKGYTNILTVARLNPEKGIDLAVHSCKTLLNRGHKIKWFVLGDGREKEHLEKLIESNGLTDHFKLLGIRENPYPYIKKADIYVQPSRYEGKSIAIDEAKILGKPIVVTNFDTAKDQIHDGSNGLIAGLTDAGISEGIEKLITDPALTKQIVGNLSAERLDTEEEIHKLYEIL